MTTPRYPQGCAAGLQARGNTSDVWVVGFNNGNVNNYHRNNDCCVRAVRELPSGEYQGADATEDVSLFDIYKAWRAARKGKKPSLNQLAFDAHWADGLLALQRALNAGAWRPGKTACFVAARPKAREIHAPDFADRVVHHWLVPQLEALWEPAFIFDSYANRRGKGSHAAVERLQHFVREVNSGQSGGYFLQLDIHNFFNSIHRPTLWAILKKKLEKHHASQTVMHSAHALLRYPPLSAGVIRHATAAEYEMVPSHKRLANAAPGCGLPIGNLSSQFLANVYLDRLDQFVKHQLKAKRYLRYVDDFVLVHHDKAQLERWQADIEKFIAEKLHLRLKPEIKLHPLKDGIDFLGYIVRPTHTLARRRVVAHANAALAAWEQKHVGEDGITATPADFRHIQSVAASYNGHLRHANSLRLQQKMHQRFSWLHTATRQRHFHYRLERRTLKIPIIKKREV